MINYTKKCNAEVKNLLYKECDVLIECRYGNRKYGFGIICFLYVGCQNR